MDRRRRPEQLIRGFHVLGALLWTWASPKSAFAYRPFDSTDADVASPGELELEVGPVGYLDEAPDRFLVAPALIANWGFTNRWELVLQGNQLIRLGGSASARRVSLLDTGLFTKGVLRAGSLQSDAGPSVATELGVLLPTLGGDSGVGVSSALIVSQRWTAVTLHLNAAFGLSRAHHADLFAGAILEGPAAWSVRPVAEVFWDREFDTTHTLSALVGAIWRVEQNLSFDAAFRRACESTTNVSEFRAGLTWAFDL
jgi:hypothetical protein